MKNFVERKKLNMGHRYGEEEQPIIVQSTPQNIAKMNIFEYWYCTFKYWGEYKTCFSSFIDSSKEFLECTWYFLANLFLLLVLPFYILVHGFFAIRWAKKYVKQEEKQKTSD